MHLKTCLYSASNPAIVTLVVIETTTCICRACVWSCTLLYTLKKLQQYLHTVTSLKFIDQYQYLVGSYKKQSNSEAVVSEFLENVK